MRNPYLQFVISIGTCRTAFCRITLQVGDVFTCARLCCLPGKLRDAAPLAQLWTAVRRCLPAGMCLRRLAGSTQPRAAEPARAQCVPASAGVLLACVLRSWPEVLRARHLWLVPTHSCCLRIHMRQRIADCAFAGADAVRMHTLTPAGKARLCTPSAQAGAPCHCRAPILQRPVTDKMLLHAAATN